MIAPREQPVDRARPHRRHGAPRRRRARGGPGPRVAQRATVLRAVRRPASATGPSPGCGCTPASTSAPPPSSRSAWQGEPPPRRRRLHVRHRRGPPAPRRDRGRARRRAARRRHRRPTGAAARHRRQPDHRPGRHLRRLRADARRRGRGPRRAARLPPHATTSDDRSTSTSSSTTRSCPTTTAGTAESVPSWGVPAVGVERRPLRLDLGPRTVVVAGDDAGPPARQLAENGSWPLLAEPSSGCRTGDTVIRTYRLLLGGRARRPHRARRGLRPPDPVPPGVPAARP